MKWHILLNLELQGYLNDLCHNFIIKNNAIPAPLNYRGFPKSTCTSLNHVVCHGIPGNKILKEGDIVNVDVTAYKDGWHGDTSRMFYVGEVSVKAKKLVETTYKSMMKAINIVNKNSKVGDIGSTIQKYVEAEGFSVVQRFLWTRHWRKISSSTQHICITAKKMRELN